MKTKLTLAGFALIVFCAAPSQAGDGPKKEEVVERKCVKEEAKDRRDEDRDRKHSRPDNKWDELCAEPELPPVLPPPVIIVPPPNDPGAVLPPPPLLPPPPMMPPL